MARRITRVCDPVEATPAGDGLDIVETAVEREFLQATPTGDPLHRCVENVKVV